MSRPKDINKFRADLQIVRESRSLLIRLNASIDYSTGRGLRKDLRKKNRELIIKLFVIVLKTWTESIVHAISSVISKAISVLRVLWLEITSKSIL
jgi:hypothetical protein